LKSNAGQLGKPLLQQAAEAIENQLKSGENLIAPGQMESLEAEFSAVLAELEPLAKPEPDTDMPEELLDAEAAREVIETLEPLIRRGNLECLDYIGSLRLIPGSAELIRQMKGYKFKAALETFSEWKKGVLNDENSENDEN
jgi:HPt (histidine-containing phosphotransfer) domain-containing protein